MRPHDDPILLIRQPRVCLTRQGPVLVGIRRAPYNARDLVEASSALEAALRASPRGLVMLLAFRLDPRFRVEPGFDRVADLAQALRTFDRALRAVASVLEFGGVRAAAMRIAARSVWTMVQPRAEHATFHRISDAAIWLAPRAREIGAADDLAAYVRGYKAAEAALREQDRDDGERA